MGSEILKVSIKCPVPDCGKSSEINIPKYVFQKNTSIIKIQIFEGLCCDQHSFLLFLNKKGNVMGYELIDHEIRIEKSVSKENQFGISDLLSMIKSAATTYVLHAIIFEYPILFVHEENLDTKKKQAIIRLLTECAPQNRKKNIRVMFFNKEEYIKSDISNYLTIETKFGAILNQPWENILMKHEENILARALDILDPEMQPIIVEDHIEMLDQQMDFVVNKIKSGSEVFEEDLKEEISHHFMIKKLSDYEIDFLKKLITRKKLADVAKIQIKSYSKLKDSLW